MNEYEKGWIVALIDSEGSLTHNLTPKGNFTSPVVKITNTNFLILAKAQSLLDGIIRAGNNPNITIWVLEITSKDWCKWLPDITLIEKENRRLEFLMWLLKWD